MSKQHHYIISYNTGSNQWELDAEAESAFMPDGTILDLDEASWHRDYSGDGEYYPEAERLTEQITKAIKQLNEGLKS
jgi:hypothetical protein